MDIPKFKKSFEEIEERLWHESSESVFNQLEEKSKNILISEIEVRDILSEVNNFDRKLKLKILFLVKEYSDEPEKISNEKLVRWIIGNMI